jgi:hypothetical protein
VRTEDQGWPGFELPTTTTFGIPGTVSRPIRPLRPGSLDRLVVGISQIKLTAAWRRPRAECNAANVDDEPEDEASMTPVRSSTFSLRGGLL